MTFRHGGHRRELARRAGRPAEEILDFSASINPLGPPEYLPSMITASMGTLVHYPDPDAAEVVAAAARCYGVPEETLVAGNGSTEILFALARAVGAPRAVIPAPCYLDYVTAARLQGLEVHILKLHEEEGFALRWPALAEQLRGGEIVFFGQPNNPTGLLFDREAFRHFAASHPATTFVVDEAFADFVEGYTTLAGNGLPNVIVVRSLTKFYAIAGLRLGLAVAPGDVARRIRDHVPPWSVNAFAQCVGPGLLADDDYARRTRQFVATRRQRLVDQMGRLPGVHVYPGAANYLLARLDGAAVDAPMLAERLLEHGIAIRTFDEAEHLDGRFFRVAVRTGDENDRLCAAIRAVLDGAW